MPHPLDNPTWHTLSGAHAHFATDGTTARRYARGFSPILGFADNKAPDLASLEPYCEAGEHFYCAGWSGPVPKGWKLEAETHMFRMVWADEPPADEGDPPFIELDASHAEQAMTLATLTQPGPFGLRTLELGDYVGVIENGQLIAMAGERMHADRYREISGVCTHPDYQGHGLARRLMLVLIRRQLRRGETPFLHVMCDNASARSLYSRMGFREFACPVVRVIARA